MNRSPGTAANGSSTASVARPRAPDASTWPSSRKTRASTSAVPTWGLHGLRVAQRAGRGRGPFRAGLGGTGPGAGSPAARGSGPRAGACFPNSATFSARHCPQPALPRLAQEALHAADPPAQAAGHHLDGVAHLDAAGDRDAGHHGAEARPAEHPFDRHPEDALRGAARPTGRRPPGPRRTRDALAGLGRDRADPGTGQEGAGQERAQFVHPAPPPAPRPPGRSWSGPPCRAGPPAAP